MSDARVTSSSARACRVLASVRREGGTLHVVIAEAGPARLEIRQAVSVVASDRAGLERLIRSARVERVVHVLPTRAAVSRCERVQATTKAEAHAAGSLLGEASLPEDAPGHRRGVGVLATGAGESWVLLTAWPTTVAGADRVPIDVEQTWAPVSACLAGLVSAGGADAAAAVADHPAGTVVALRVSAERCSIRTMVEEPGSPEWNETIASIGDGDPNAAGSRLVLSASVRSGLAVRVSGAGIGTGSAWWNTFGLGVGALRAAADDSLEGLASLSVDGRTTREMWPVRVASWLKQPKHAMAMAGVGAATLLFGPLVAAWANEAILSRSAEPYLQNAKRAKELKRHASLYRQFEESRWPMTKLWAEVSRATPVGVIVEDLRLAPEMEYGLAIRGTADNADAFSQLQRSLNGSGLITAVRIDRTETTPDGVSFDLSARVIDAQSPGKGLDDFAARTLQTRIYVEGSGPRVAAAEPEPEPEMDQDMGDEAPAEDRPGATNARRDPPPRSTRPGIAAASDPNALPPPLTDDEINAMDAKALLGWTSRSVAAKRAGIDPSEKARLEDEVRKMRERYQQLTSKKSDAPTTPPPTPPTPPPTPPANPPASSGGGS